MDRAVLAQTLPEFFRDERSQRSQQHQKCTEFLTPNRLPSLQNIKIPHQRGDGGIVFQGCEIFCHAFDQAMQIAASLLLKIPFLSVCRVLRDKRPDAVEKTHNATYTTITEVTARVVGPHKHQVDSDYICAKTSEIVIRVNNVAFRLRDLCAILCNHAMSAEASKWFIELQEAKIVQGHGDKTSIH